MSEFSRQMKAMREQLRAICSAPSETERARSSASCDSEDTPRSWRPNGRSAAGRAAHEWNWTGPSRTGDGRIACPRSGAENNRSAPTAACWVMVWPLAAGLVLVLSLPRASAAGRPPGARRRPTCLKQVGVPKICGTITRARFTPSRLRTASGAGRERSIPGISPTRNS